MAPWMARMNCQAILSLPPDDWVMQPKIDGIRVIIYGSEPFNRLGQPLSESKGAAALRAMFKGVVETLDGEWVPKQAKYYAFDLPRTIAGNGATIGNSSGSCCS
jgi:ATP-dependent DNA ligase